jgi:uncharacterized repeat protein (TIGR03803 family)
MKTKLLIILLATFATLAARGQQYQLLHHFAVAPYGPRAELLEGGDGYFYGTTTGGGPYDKGTIFKVNSSGDVTVIHSFTGAEGANPYCALIPGGNGKFYGTTSSGGESDLGTVFSADPSGNVTTLHSFSGEDGSGPGAGLISGTDGMLYGTTIFGGTGSGTIFKIDLSGQFSELHAFAGTDGAWPIAGLIQGSDGNFYGTTYIGGASGSGTIFKMDPAGAIVTLHHFAGAPSDGSSPAAALKQGSDGNFYGTTQYGGINDAGTIFKIVVIGNPTPLYSSIYSFGGAAGDGTSPYARLIQGSDGYFYGTTLTGGTGDHGTIFKIDTSGVLTILHSLAGEPMEGEIPYAGVIQAADGNLYGVTGSGGPSDNGTIFKLALTPAVTFTTLHTFSSGDGNRPTSPLTQAADGNLYGVTNRGGPTESGTIYKIDLFGHVTTVHAFMGTDGRFPAGEGLMDATLLAGSDGNLYGNTWAGGSDDKGTLFKMNLLGNLTTLHSFTGPTPDLPLGNPADGAFPAGGLVEGSDGNFYGTTTVGGTATVGTAFKMDQSGTVSTLHSFTGYVVGGMVNPPDGSVPNGSLIQANDGNFYGTTILGGINQVFGTVFKMNSLGVETIVYTFLGHTDTSLDGSFPEASIIEVGNGQFYGTTTGGGTNDSGTVFSVDSSGNRTFLHSFVNTDGSFPKGELIRGSDGNLYGTTEYGGPDSRPMFPLDGNGTVFKIDSLGNLTTLHFFSGADGAHPRARLLLASDGNLYGTTVSGGSADVGVVFRIVTGPTPLNVVSRKAHGSAGTFDIDLPQTGTPGIECRSGPVSGNHRVIVTFTSAVTLTDATATPGQNGTASLQLVPGADHAQVLVDLSNVSNGQTLIINLLGVSDGTRTGDVHVPMAVLLGDADASRRTDAGDVTAVRNRTVSIPDQQTFRFDVNTSGRIDAGDVTVTRNASVSVLP